MKFTVDGDGALGYKIIVEAAGAAAQDLYVVKHAGQFKIAAFSKPDRKKRVFATSVLEAGLTQTDDCECQCLVLRSDRYRYSSMHL